MLKKFGIFKVPFAEGAPILQNQIEFKIPFYQYLNPEGKLLHQPPFELTKPLLEKYFRILNLIRIFDKKAVSLQRTGRMGTYAPVYGQEAIGAVIGHCLESQDIFIPYYRDYACLYQRNVKLQQFLQYWGGDERASLYHPSSKDFPICVPIASQCQHAVGVAYALKYQKSKQMVLVTIGDGGTSEGDFYEAINAAGVWSLPMVVVIINNQWAISVPRDAQTKAQTLAQKAIAAGIPGIQVDGNDTLALHACIEQAIANARGPAAQPMVIEALTYRLSDHTTADDAKRYQPADEYQTANQLEPIIRLKKFISDQDLMSETEQNQMLKACEAEVEQAIEAYLTEKPQDIREIFDYHFAELPSYLIEQRATAIEEFQDAEH